MGRSGGRNVLPNKEMQAHVLILFLSQHLLQHSRVHVYTPSWSETRKYLSKLTKVLLAENIMQDFGRANWNSHNIVFYS